MTFFFFTCVCSCLFTKAVHHSCAMFLKHTLRGRVMFWSCLAFTFFFKNNFPHYCLARSSVFKKESPGPWEVPKGVCPPPPFSKSCLSKGVCYTCMALFVRSMQYFQVVLQAEIEAKLSTSQDLGGLESLPPSFKRCWNALTLEMMCSSKWLVWTKGGLVPKGFRW